MSDKLQAAVVQRLSGARRGFAVERDDKNYDAILRHKNYHITAFSMCGLITMFLVQIASWQVTSEGDDMKDAYIDDPNVSASMLNILYTAQAIITTSTVVTVVLITQKYRLLLMRKRADWSGEPMYALESARGDAIVHTESRARLSGSYSFWRSHMKWGYLLEVATQLPHPVLWMATAASTTYPKNVSYKFLQLYMFVRLSVLYELLHLNSKAYFARTDIIANDPDLASVGYKISRALTLKIRFYDNTAAFVVTGIAATIIIFGFAMFTMERVEGPIDRSVRDQQFSSIGNSIYFSYVTATTIGYGEYSPVGFLGRIVAGSCAIVGVSVFTLFTGVLVSRVSLSREQKQGLEYCDSCDANGVYLQAAARLRRMFVEDIVLVKWREQDAAANDVVIEKVRVKASHKGNQMHSAIKALRNARANVQKGFMQADDPVVNKKMSAINELMRAVHDEAEEHGRDFREFEENVQGRFRQILQNVTKYSRLGHAPV
jgi:hypothetical protein